MAPAEDPRPPEGTAGDSQSSPGCSALHSPQPLGFQARGPGVFREHPGWAAPRLPGPRPPHRSLALSDPAGICPQGLTRVLLELEVLGSKERRQGPPDPRGSSQPGVRAPDRQGGPGGVGAALWALTALLIQRLSIYSVSSFHLLSCSSR